MSIIPDICLYIHDVHLVDVHQPKKMKPTFRRWNSWYQRLTIRLIDEQFGMDKDPICHWGQSQRIIWACGRFIRRGTPTIDRRSEQACTMAWWSRCRTTRNSLSLWSLETIRCSKMTLTKRQYHPGRRRRHVNQGWRQCWSSFSITGALFTTSLSRSVSLITLSHLQSQTLRWDLWEVKSKTTWRHMLHVVSVCREAVSTLLTHHLVLLLLDFPQIKNVKESHSVCGWQPASWMVSRRSASVA